MVSSSPVLLTDNSDSPRGAECLTKESRHEVGQIEGRPSIAFDEIGSGPPLVLFDGALCSRSIGPSTKLAAALAEHFTVFTYDRRGRGDSEDTAPYAVEREVEDLEAVVGAAGGSACVYGVSSGAALALEAAARGVAISKLALYEAPFIVDASRPPVPLQYGEQLGALLAIAAAEMQSDSSSGRSASRVC